VTAPRESILSFEEARHLVEEHAAEVRPHGRELVGLLDAYGRVLAEPIAADRDFPPFARAARDGYAVRAADAAEIPATLEIVREIRAGEESEGGELRTGQAAAIMTGAPVPAGADAVIMIEFTSRTEDRVKIERPVASGENIVPRGSECRRGDSMLTSGSRLDGPAIAAAAAIGRSRVVVHSRPRVAVLSTGDEIVDVDVNPGPNQIRNSNSYSLAAQIWASGGEPVLLPIAPDEPVRLRELLREGLDSDLLLISGGVSMGKYDLVEQSLTELEAEFYFTGAKIQPGKPIVFGAARQAGKMKSAEHRSRKEADPRTYFFGLPGNPISTMVCFELFARPLIGGLAGMSSHKLTFLQARLKKEIKTKTGLTRFLPGLISGEFAESEVELVAWQGSGDIRAMARSNCHIVIPPDRERIAAGALVSVLLR
jgi:molybdopterin molybdotransferase